MKTSNLITLFGLLIILIYAIIQLFKLFDIGLNYIGVYLAFYLFLILCYFVLPSKIDSPQNI